MNFFLGIVCLGHHDSAAVLINDKGKILAGAEEERYTRIKFDPSFPKNSIDFCLNSNGLKITDVTSVGYFFDSKSYFWKRLFFALKKPYYFQNYISKYFKLKKYENIKKIFKSHYPEYSGKINFHNLHLCHAASVFLTSPQVHKSFRQLDRVAYTACSHN